MADCTINTTAVIVGTVTATATVINSGIHNEPCPIILCIDGGAADTASYPAVNGLLNGGSS